MVTELQKAKKIEGGVKEKEFEFKEFDKKRLGNKAYLILKLLYD